jgi:hypothetical protein
VAAFIEIWTNQSAAQNANFARSFIVASKPSRRPIGQRAVPGAYLENYFFVPDDHSFIVSLTSRWSVTYTSKQYHYVWKYSHHWSILQNGAVA